MTAFAVIMVPSVHSQLTYTLTELSLGGTWGTAVGLNEGGQVTGRSLDAQGHGQAFIYDPITGIQEISLDGTWSEPFAIGETGQVVGFSQNSEGGQSAFLYGRIEYLNLPNSYTGELWGYNQKGQVIGVSDIEGGSQAFVYDPTRGIQQLSLGGSWGNATDINEAGQVIGYSENAAGEPQAFVYDPVHGIQELSLGGDYGGASEITESGYVRGYSATGMGEEHAFLYHPSIGIQKLTLGGTSGSAYDVNEGRTGRRRVRKCRR